MANTVRTVSLRTWFELRDARLGDTRDLAVKGQLSSFYYWARGNYGGTNARKSAQEWNDLYRRFREGTLTR